MAMPKFGNVLLILLGAAVCGSVFGQGTLEEIIRGEMQISKGKKWLKRDTAEAEAFTALVAQYTAANEESREAMTPQIVETLQREVGQSMEKLEQAKKEAGRSSMEALGQNITLKRDEHRADNDRDHAKVDAVLSSLALAKDKKDKKDDIQDAIAIGERAKRQSEILTAFSSPDGIDAVAAGAYLVEFQQILAADMEATQAEIKEDRREVAEDKRLAEIKRKKKQRNKR